jgi:hypothetical protein
MEVAVRGGTGLSFAYRAASGRPITPLIPIGGGEIAPGEVNSERLPSYHRFDVKIEHQIEGKKHKAFLYLDVLNVTNQRNIVDLIQFLGAGGRVVRIYTHGVGIMPVAGFGFYL